MKIIDTAISGLKICGTNKFTDNRGSFTKVFNNDFFETLEMNINVQESYFSVSKKDVIRGMHFQTPPYDHIKIVYVPVGSIIDVVLDIRKGSPTFGQYFEINLSANNGKMIIIPKGFAHGFKSLEDDTIVSYLQTTGYAPEYDKGILYNSFGYDWNIFNEIVSLRDLDLPDFNKYDSPFKYGEIL